MLKINKYHIPEKEYLQSITDRLSETQANGEVVLIALCAKLAGYADPMEISPVFAYRAGDKNSNEIVLSWAEAISRVNYLISSLKVNFLIATMDEEEFNSLVEKTEEIEDLDLTDTIWKYKEAVAEANKE